MKTLSLFTFLLAIFSGVAAHGEAEPLAAKWEALSAKVATLGESRAASGTFFRLGRETLQTLQASTPSAKLTVLSPSSEAAKALPGKIDGALASFLGDKNSEPLELEHLVAHTQLLLVCEEAAKKAIRVAVLSSEHVAHVIYETADGSFSIAIGAGE